MIKANSKALLHQVWKYKEFFPPQEQIIESVMSGNDTLALLPTGGGKSLCYQIPALLSDGITIVISPLMALIKDQIQELQQKGIKAYYLSSEQSYLGQIDVFDYVREQDCKILYVAPERLQNSVFVQSLKSLKISLIAIDEAHCVSEWGNDFRPSYSKIKEFRSGLDNPPTIALTATATPDIQEDIVEKLGLQETHIFKSSFARDNLEISINQTENKFQQLLHILNKHQGSAIVYARTRQEAKNVAQQLKDANLSADFFHAGMTEREKNKKQKAWMTDQLRILVATNAFGMGINKANVRTIVHYNIPYTIENYYQEIGRAGRDGKTAYTYLLYNDFDIHKTYEEFKSFYVSKSEYRTILQKLYNRWNWAKNEMPLEPISFDFDAFCRDYKFQKSKVQTVLQLLNKSGYIGWQPNPKNSQIHFRFHPSYIDQTKGMEKLIIESLSRNILGIFHEKVSFDEKFWAKSFHIAQNELNGYFKKWSDQDLIDYENGQLSKVYILNPREDAILFGRIFKGFNDHQKQKRIKLKNLFYLLKNQSECRMNLLLRYFGEKQKMECEQCDVCHSKHKKDSTNLENMIYQYIQSSDRSLQQIISEYAHIQPNDIIDAIQFLLQENKVKNINYHTYTAKT